MCERAVKVKLMSFQMHPKNALHLNCKIKNTLVGMFAATNATNCNIAMQLLSIDFINMTKVVSKVLLEKKNLNPRSSAEVQHYEFLSSN